MADFALECFRCTQIGIEVTLLPSNDGILHVKLTRGDKELTEYIKGPTFAGMSIAAFRHNLLHKL